MKCPLLTVTLLLTLQSFGIQFPVSTDKTVEISRKQYYTLGYSEQDEQALWVMYDLTSNQLCSASVRRFDCFRTDTNITTLSASPSDYKNSGYDKGHLCPAGDRSFDKYAMNETFLMSNMSPQEQQFNRGIWKTLEEFTRDYAIFSGEITVITGPVIFNKHFSLTNNVSVPQMYYKVLVNTNKQECLCYLIPNQESKKELTDYLVDIKYVETLTGLKFGKLW